MVQGNFPPSSLPHPPNHFHETLPTPSPCLPAPTGFAGGKGPRGGAKAGAASTAAADGSAAGGAQAGAGGGPGARARAPSAELAQETAEADEAEWACTVAGAWPFQGLCDQLCVDMLDATWEVGSQLARSALCMFVGMVGMRRGGEGGRRAVHGCGAGGGKQAGRERVFVLQRMRACMPVWVCVCV